jgi:hypothetical protein
MTISASLAGRDDKDAWDRMVATSPHTHAFHYWELLEILARHSHTTLFPIIISEEGVGIGGFPLFVKRVGGLRGVFSPPPGVAVPRLGPFFVREGDCTQYRKESVMRDFYASATELLLTTVKPHYVATASSRLRDARWLLWRGYYVTPTYNYTIPIEEGPDTLWRSIRGKVRGDITRARRRGFTVRTGERSDLAFLYRQLEERYKEQGRQMNVAPLLLYDVFDALSPKKSHIFVVEKEGEIVSGIIDIYYGNTALTWFGLGKAPEHTNDLLVWEALVWAFHHGYKQYGTMGIAGTLRLSRFYFKFNPSLFVSYKAEWFSSSPVSALIKTIQWLHSHQEI